MNQLQKNVKRLVAYGNEIRQCRDTRSFKKIIPLLEEEKDVHVVTADDDVCYWREWLAELIDSLQALFENWEEERWCA